MNTVKNPAQLCGVFYGIIAAFNKKGGATEKNKWERQRMDPAIRGVDEDEGSPLQNGVNDTSPCTLL
jgi:hypothetical protein